MRTLDSRTNGEEQRLQVVELLFREGQKASAAVHLRASRLLILLECVGGNHQEGGAGVDNTSGAGEQRGVIAIGEILVNAPVLTSRRSLRNGREGNISSVP